MAVMLGLGRAMMVVFENGQFVYYSKMVNQLKKTYFDYFPVLTVDCLLQGLLDLDLCWKRKMTRSKEG